MTYPSPSEPRPQAPAPDPVAVGFDSSPPSLQTEEPRGSLSEGRCFSPARPGRSKLCFRSAAAARKFVRKVPGGARDGRYPYLCDCGSWHLSSTKDRTL